MSVTSDIYPQTRTNALANSVKAAGCETFPHHLDLFLAEQLLTVPGQQLVAAGVADEGVGSDLAKPQHSYRIQGCQLAVVTPLGQPMGPGCFQSFHFVLLASK